MASNSEANLSSDFDIDEVINWGEQNFSSKGNEFQLPQFCLPADVKKTQNTPVTLPNLGSAEATSQDGQSSNSFYPSIFGVANNPSVVTKNHGFSSGQAMVPPNALSFPSGNINIPSLATSNSPLLQFTPNLVGQNSSLRGQLCVPSMQNVEDSNNLINDEVPPFDDSDDLIEGPLDRIVDQIMERQSSERITDSPSSSFDDDTPIITATYSNRQATQLSSNVSPQNVPPRNVLSPNAPSRNVSSPNMQSSNINIRSSPSPNTPSHQVPSPSNPTQNILSPSPPSRNVPVQKITTSTRIIPPNISPPNVPSQNIPSPMQHSSSHTFSTMQGLSSQTSEQSLPPQLHSTYRLQSPVSVPSSMVGSLGQTTMSSLNTLNPVSNLPISLGQTEVTTNSLFQGNSAQRNNQSFPSFLLQNTNQTLIQQPSKQVWPQSGGNKLEGMLQAHKKGRPSSSQLDKNDFTNAPPNFTSVLTNKASQSNVLSFIPTNIGSDSSTTMNLNGQSITVSSTQFNKNIDSIPKTISDQLHSGIPPSTSYPGEASNIFSAKSLASSITGSTNDELQITSIGRTIQNPTTQPLGSPLTNTSVNNFFVQNSSNVIQSTNNENRNEIIFSNTISQSQNVMGSNNQNLTQGHLEAPSLSQQNKSVFKLLPPLTMSSQGNSPTQATSLFKSQPSTISSKPAGITTIKITSPSANNAGFKYSTGLTPNPSLKAVSIQPPRKAAVTVKSPTNVSTTSFPTFKLTQASLATSGNVSNTKPMVFTLAPGSQAFKGFPANLKDKLTGRQVIFLQQPSGQPINTPKPQPMKIVFVNDSSIAQVVSGEVKSKVPAQSSAVPVISTTPGLNVSAKTSAPSNESKAILTTSTEGNHDSDAASPASVTSVDSDSIPIAALKQSEALKRKEHESKIEAESKGRGRKRRKDPNRPVKPLSTFQRFFQATQPTIRQQNPQATFTEVSKTIKEMWENISPKDKKVYQDAWRMERVQYKKAMEEYNAAKIETDALDGPSAKQAKHVIEIEDDVSTVSPIPVSQVDIPPKTERPSVTSLTATSASLAVSSSSPAPRSSGKPLAMMAEMANKTKLASAQAAAAKSTAVTKSLHHSKNKASNGIEDSGTHVVKKKTKINPLPKKSCIRSHCNKPAKFTKERGTMFCSNDCLMRYCRGVFRSWVDTRRQTLKAAT